jgi:hypothetical protein
MVDTTEQIKQDQEMKVKAPKEEDIKQLFIDL